MKTEISSISSLPTQKEEPSPSIKFNIIPFLKPLSVIGQGSGGIIQKAIYEPKNLYVALKVEFRQN